MSLDSDKVKELREQLDVIIKYSNEVDNASVRDVERKYRKLVKAVEEFDELARDVGLEYTQGLNINVDRIESDSNPYKFFFNNELWNHPDFEDEVTRMEKTILNTLYSLPFAYEVSDAYDERVKVERAGFALGAANRKKEELDAII